MNQYLDKGPFSCGVFVDLQKKTTTADHEILRKKLWLYNIRRKKITGFDCF